MRNAIPTLVFLALSLIPLGTIGQEAVPEPFTPAEQALHIAVSRFCVNEAFHHLADCALIWQTVRRHGQTPEARLAWLTEQSTCVLAAQDPPPGARRRGNCPWARHLQDNDIPPLNWPRGWVWTGVNARDWQRTRDFVRSMMRGARPRGGWPCPIDPDTWGGRRTDEERIRNLPPSMVALRCTVPGARERDTLNEGFREMTPEQRARYDARFPPRAQQPLQQPFVDIQSPSVSAEVDRD